MKQKITPSFDNNRHFLGKIFPLSAPFTIVLDSSEACNFKCQYCFRSEQVNEAWGDYACKKELMKWDTFVRAVEQIKQFHDIKVISLSNHGEPLCNRQLPKMVKYIKAQGLKCRTSIHTNASLLDEEYAKELGQSGIDKVVVSLQGMDAETYKRVCGTDIDFDRFYHALATLYANKAPDSKINIKIMDIAVGDRVEEFYEKFSLIADAVFVEKVVPIWKNVGDGSLKPETMMNKYGSEFPYQECCPLLFDTLVVTPDGDVYPCTQITSKEKLGNIFDSTLVEMWNSDYRKELLRRQLLLTPPESCNGCFIKQNSIFTKEDMIDDYREEILKKL